MSEEDHYEILGVRPEAPLWEIELAFKGRRTQYHPDRYTAGDEAAIAWATAKMQAVNKAYSVLKDPEQRERFDRSRAAGRSRPEPEQEFRRTKPEPPPLRTLRQALKPLEFNNEPFERVFVAPYIPRKKLQGALDSYGMGMRAQDVVALIDNTVFGGAREGILITESCVRYKAPFEPVDERPLECISNAVVEGGDIYIDGRRYAQLHMPDHSDIRKVFRAVALYLMSENNN